MSNKLYNACRDLLAEVYIGGGKVVAPPALISHLRAISEAMSLCEPKPIYETVRYVRESFPEMIPGNAPMSDLSDKMETPWVNPVTVKIHAKKERVIC